MKKTIGIFAHVDAGKTTLSEQILYKAGAILNLGTVEKKNTVFDYNEIEKSRGITVFSDEAYFSIGEDNYNIIDTPGHVDFSGEMERVILAIDCAIIVVSGTDGIQSHTETIWRLLEKNNKPVIIFINKCDRENSNIKKTINDIHNLWKCNTVVFDDDFKMDSIEFTDEIIEQIVINDDDLMEDYIEGVADKEEIEYKCGAMINSRSIIPVIMGSAINGVGVQAVFSILKRYYGRSFELLLEKNSNKKELHKDDNVEKFRGIVYKIRHDKSGVRLTFIKVLSGVLKPKEEIKSICNDDIVFQKINEMKVFAGKKSKQIISAYKGDLCAVTGLINVKPGDIIGEDPKEGAKFDLMPLMKVSVIAEDSSIPNEKIIEVLKKVEEEEMLLRVSYDKAIGEVSIETMGDIQLEALQTIISDRYNINISFGESKVLYKETIKNPVVGCGHFEPLKHYAEVHLRLEPSKHGEGITFNSKCSYDVLAKNWQNLIKTHIFEKEHRGVLIGAPICDIRFTLLSGRAHLKHTNGGDFREAVYRAIRQGLRKTSSVILEPWYSFELQIEDIFVGRVLNDIGIMGGEYEPPEHNINTTIIRGRCPVKNMINYRKEFNIFTKGKGNIVTFFDGYYECVDMDNVIKEAGYNIERDVENTADSVFCSHGSGYTVKWDEADSTMHIPIEII